MGKGYIVFAALIVGALTLGGIYAFDLNSQSEQLTLACEVGCIPNDSEPVRDTCHCRTDIGWMEMDLFNAMRAQEQALKIQEAESLSLEQQRANDSETWKEGPLEAAPQFDPFEDWDGQELPESWDH